MDKELKQRLLVTYTGGFPSTLTDAAQLMKLKP